MSEKARLLQQAGYRCVFLEKFLNTMKSERFSAAKIGTALVLLALVGASACKPRSESDPEPYEMRTEPVAQTLKDVELDKSAVNVNYQRVFNVTLNVPAGVEKFEVLLDISDIRPAVEAFIAARPNEYSLYFRLENREPQTDLTLPDGTRKLRAGALGGVSLAGNNVQPAGGTLVEAKQMPYDWNRVRAELQKTASDMLLPRIHSNTPGKLVLSVYDYSRFLQDPSAFGPFDGSTARSHADGGSRVVYRGWNVELK